ncbi:MAG: GGDEF domain-containing protein [Deltaproteobacteria bacterium]|nr:GGDEF domain-containing protein [Candidatus Anaeroferrophillus wilburensis]MBN2888353.1 GGDEF domain-containing protein [Deltaproteobacteria bacterium]
MVKTILQLIQQARESAQALWAPMLAKRRPFLAGHQLAFSGIPFSQAEMMYQADHEVAGGSQPQPLKFIQHFFNAMSNTHQDTLLTTAGSLLLQLAGNRKIVFVEYDHGSLILHTPGPLIEADSPFGQQILKAGKACYRKTGEPITGFAIQSLEGFSQASQISASHDHLSQPVGPHEIGPEHLLAAFFAGDKDQWQWSRETDQLLNFCLQHVAIRMREIQTLTELRSNANTDPLTGVHNRRFFHQTLTRESERASRHHQPLSLIMLDIDHFKTVNDTFGHLTGDHILQQVSTLARESIRTIDTISRYGGEEFVVILPQTAITDAAVIAERLRTRIARFPFLGPGDKPLAITASLGVACWPGSGCLSRQGTELVQAADRALYAAKDTGRNRTCTAPSQPLAGTGSKRKAVVFVPPAC